MSPSVADTPPGQTGLENGVNRGRIARHLRGPSRGTWALQGRAGVLPLQEHLEGPPHLRRGGQRGRLALSAPARGPSLHLATPTPAGPDVPATSVSHTHRYCRRPAAPERPRRDVCERSPLGARSPGLGGGGPSQPSAARPLGGPRHTDSGPGAGSTLLTAGLPTTPRPVRRLPRADRIAGIPGGPRRGVLLPSAAQFRGARRLRWPSGGARHPGMMARLGGGLMACTGQLDPTAAPGQATCVPSTSGSGTSLPATQDGPMRRRWTLRFDLRLRLLCLLPNLEPMLFIFRSHSSNFSLKCSSLPPPQVHRGNRSARRTRPWHRG